MRLYHLSRTCDPLPLTLSILSQNLSEVKHYFQKIFVKFLTGAREKKNICSSRGKRWVINPSPFSQSVRHWAYLPSPTFLCPCAVGRASFWTCIPYPFLCKTFGAARGLSVSSAPVPLTLCILPHLMEFVKRFGKDFSLRFEIHQ